MQTRNRIFDDAAKLAGGAVGTLEGVRREVETLVRQQVERMLSKFDLVTRDELTWPTQLFRASRSGCWSATALAELPPCRICTPA